ncbi:hypothetical protein DSO57_1010165 [Entomophthora muscae]|uniref:Uncharacterized protein n=1 Tax=Entomophthora muscae TaxID=34485 RepID=A0ACC2UFG8_9FUNG|nr:hypothetical protein DSO57_1010165 [Entomophthora muscae]
MSLSAAMAEWKLDLNTYGLQIEEEKKQHGPIFSDIGDVPNMHDGTRLLVLAGDIAWDDTR